MSFQPGDEIVFEQEIWFDGYQYGTTGGIPSGQIKIQRGSDGKFWDGAAFDTPEVWVATSVDAGGLFHSYPFAFPEIAGVSEIYKFRMRANTDSNTESIFSVLLRAYET